jgi:arylsulfatase A-like enzyme
LYVDAFDPHDPWDPPQHYIDMYDPGYDGEIIDHPKYDWVERLGLSEREVKNIRARYAGEVTLVDTWVQRIFEKIERCGIEDETVVIFHADHGHLVGDHGRMGKGAQPTEKHAWPFYEEIGHVPLIVRMPGGPKGERNHFLAQAVDIMPTILDMAGLEIPEGVKGVSLAPALRGEAMRERKVAVSIFASHAGYEGEAHKMASVTDGEFTLHYRGNEHPWELFNVLEDPKQKNDLSKSHRTVAERLHADHLEHMRYAGESEEKLSKRNVLPEIN